MESSNPLPPSHPVTPHDTMNLPATTPSGRRWRAAIVGVLLVLLVAGVVAVFIFDFPMSLMAGQAQIESSPPAPLGVQQVADNTLMVPKDVREALGIRKDGAERIYDVKRPTRMRPIVMPGSTAFDPARLYRIRVRFAPCEAVEIAKVPDDSPRPPGTYPFETPPPRELRTEDPVKKGDLLAVVYSVDVGQQKNTLIDAISQLKLDEKILDEADKASGSLSYVYILGCQRNVEADHNNISKAMNTLKAWNIPKKDIDACFAEADEIMKRRGHREHNAADLAKWARVEIRAPEDGIIIECNVSVHETVIDNTVNLFQIAKVDRLRVFANVPEDEAPILKALPTEKRRWTVKTVGSEPVVGTFNDVGYIIDPNQHTAIVKGYIDNPKGVMRAGQFISASVELPPPEDVVEVPVDAVVEDGQTCVVFVQDKNDKERFTMRRVQPAARFDTTVFILSKPFAKGEERTAEEEELKILPKEPLRPGERILMSGVGELKAALLDLQSQPKK